MIELKEDSDEAEHCVCFAQARIELQCPLQVRSGTAHSGGRIRAAKDEPTSRDNAGESRVCGGIVRIPGDRFPETALGPGRRRRLPPVPPILTEQAKPVSLRIPGGRLTYTCSFIACELDLQRPADVIGQLVGHGEEVCRLSLVGSSP